MQFQDNALRGRYAGDGGTLFRLAFKTALLTLVTLGLYRFWAKTRIRKYIWSSVSADGDAFEYTGTGLEKFLGFLVAVVILAVYLAAIQMLLFFFGLNLFVGEPETLQEAISQMAAFYISVLAIVPLWFFAKYRARRYKLARTRWRGIRFGAEPAAWGYALRAIGHTILTILTLGILLPRQTFWLEKYVTDRSWFGNAQFRQEGQWSALYPAMKHFFFGVAIIFAGGILATAGNAPIAGIVLGAVGYVWVAIGFVYYRVRAFEYLTSTKVLDENIRFQAALSTGQIIRIVVIGSILVAVVSAILFGVAGGFLATAASGLILNEGPGVALVVSLLIYVGALLTIGAMTLAVITQPIIRHVVEGACVVDASGLSAIRQRAADPGADAEGFADALDVGGAF